MLDRTCSQMKAGKYRKKQKAKVLAVGTAMKGILERTWSKMKAENRRKKKKRRRKMQNKKGGKIQKDELQENVNI